MCVLSRRKAGAEPPAPRLGYGRARLRGAVGARLGTRLWIDRGRHRGRAGRLLRGSGTRRRPRGAARPQAAEPRALRGARGRRRRGGAPGALGCGVVAIRVLGVRGAFLAAAGLDAAVAVAALALARRTAAPAARRETGAQGAPPRLALVLAAAAGFAGLAGEVLWTRGLAGVLSQSVYSIALVLAAVLVGVALGAAA